MSTGSGVMNAAISLRPAGHECNEYYHRYLSLVPDGDIVTTLEREHPVTLALLETIPAARETWAYERGKWSFREAVGHLVDMERVFSLRALWIARDPDTPLPSFEQNVWAANSNARDRALRDLLDEWASVRAATLTMVRSLDASALLREGMASGMRFTVRSLVWLTAGHELHHRKIFRERYGLADGGASVVL